MTALAARVRPDIAPAARPEAGAGARPGSARTSPRPHDPRPVRVLWSALYAGVGGAVFWYRVLVPLRQAHRHQWRVDAVVRESRDVMSVVIRGRHLDELRAQSGQFLRDLAVATSGISERGAHLVDPLTGAYPTRFAAATVVGPSLTRADAFATAAFLMGKRAMGWIAGVEGYELLLVGVDGTRRPSAGWRRLVHADPEVAA